MKSKNRLDLISSAFDEILLQDENPTEEQKNSEVDNQQPSFGEEFKGAVSSKEQQDKNWANFGDTQTNNFWADSTSWQQASTSITSNDFGFTDEKEQIILKDQLEKQDVFEGTNKGFESFGVTDDQAKPNEDNAFPSLFDAVSTPRIDNENKSDIRMSFPAEQMWSHNFSENKKEKKKESDDIWSSAFEEVDISKPEKQNQSK